MTSNGPAIATKELLAPLGSSVRQLRRAVATTERLLHFVEHEGFRNLAKQSQIFVVDFQELYTYMYQDSIPTLDSLASSYILDSGRLQLCLGPGTLYEIWQRLAPRRSFRTGEVWEPESIGGILGEQVVEQLANVARSDEDAQAISRLSELVEIGKVRWLGEVLHENGLELDVDEGFANFARRILDFRRPKRPRSNQADATNLAAVAHASQQKPARLWCRLLTHTSIVMSSDLVPIEDPVAEEYDFPTTLTVRPLELLADTVLREEDLDYLADLRIACAHLRNQVSGGPQQATRPADGIDWDALIAKMQLLSAGSEDELAQLRTFVSDPLISRLQERLLLNEQSNVILSGDDQRYIAQAERLRGLLSQILEAAARAPDSAEKGYLDILIALWFEVDEEAAQEPERSMIQVNQKGTREGILRSVEYSDFRSIYWSSYVGVREFCDAVVRAWPSLAPSRAIVEGISLRSYGERDLSLEKLPEDFTDLEATLVELEFETFIVVLDTFELLEHGHAHVGITCRGKLSAEALGLFERTAAFLPVMPAFRRLLEVKGVT